MRRLLGPVVAMLVVASACSGTDTSTTTDGPPPSATTSLASTQPVATTATQPPLVVDLTAGAAASASLEVGGFEAAAAIDGDIGTWWSAGDDPSQYIEIYLGVIADIHEIRLVPSQDPSGATLHRILDGSGAELHVLEGPTADLEELTVTPAEPWTAVTRIRIETTSSPSWVAWREIQVLGVVTGEIENAGADTVFVGGTIETMSVDLATSNALAITDGVIVALGDEARALIGAATSVVDLDGKAVLPGIVDPHTHVLSDDPVGFDEAQDRHIALGYTTIGDTGLEPDELATVIDHAESGDLRIRMIGYLDRTDNCGVDKGTWYEAHAAGTWYGDRFRINGVKIFNDGGTCGPLASSEPFFEGVEIGPTFQTDDALADMIRVAESAGYQVVIHAQGDLAVRGAQNALETVLAGGDNVLRHRIDHNAIVTPDLLPRYAEIGIVTLAFGAWATCTDFPLTQFFRDYGEDWRALLDANPGGHIAWHGDDPWAPPFDPLGDLYSYVTRAEVAEDGSVCEPEPWLAEHTITVDEALVMMTREAAYALNVDDLVGTLEVGKLADLIVLDASPRAIDAADIPGLRILATWMDGRVEYCAEGSTVCG